MFIHSRGIFYFQERCFFKKMVFKSTTTEKNCSPTNNLSFAFPSLRTCITLDQEWKEIVGFCCFFPAKFSPTRFEKTFLRVFFRSVTWDCISCRFFYREIVQGKSGSVQFWGEGEGCLGEGIVLFWNKRFRCQGWVDALCEWALLQFNLSG